MSNIPLLSTRMNGSVHHSLMYDASKLSRLFPGVFRQPSHIHCSSADTGENEQDWTCARSHEKKFRTGILCACASGEMRDRLFLCLAEKFLKVEQTDETGYTEPSGFHLVQLPFADDLRAAPIEKACRGLRCTAVRKRWRIHLR